MSDHRTFTAAEARSIGDEIGIGWTVIPLEEFRVGLSVELEHGAHDPKTNVTGDDPILTGQIALAHLKEFSDYYTRLTRMEDDAEVEKSYSVLAGAGRPHVSEKGEGR